VAVGADIGVNLRLGGSGLICVPACAANGRRGVYWVDIGFHDVLSGIVSYVAMNYS
jgi:hypothetical protein